MNDHGIPTADAIASGFPHPVLPRIDEPPARVGIDMAQEMQTENAVSRPSTRGGGIQTYLYDVIFSRDPRSRSLQVSIRYLSEVCIQLCIHF